MSSQKEQQFESWEAQADDSNKKFQQTEQQKKIQQVDAPEKQGNELEIKQSKKTLQHRIWQYKAMTFEQFDAKNSENDAVHRKPIKIGGKILKSQKDFNELGKQIAGKLCQKIGPQDTLDDQSITLFIQQLILYIYSGLNWENLFEISKKLKMLKNQRKIDEKKLKKNKKTKQNKQEEEETKISTKQQKNEQVQKDDLFGGIATMSSKQEEEQRKKKAGKKQQQQQQTQPTPATAADDDDDFM